MTRFCMSVIFLVVSYKSDSNWSDGTSLETSNSQLYNFSYICLSLESSPLFSKILLSMNLDVVGTVTRAVGCVMLEHLVGWFLLEYASSPGTGNALMYLEKSDARKYLNLQEPFD